MSKKRLRLSDKIPMVTTPISRDLRMFCDRVRDVLGGDGEQKVATVGDLISIGLVDNNLRPIAPAADGEFLPTPPAVTNLTADGAFQNVILYWDQPEYNGHAYTEVWGSPIYDTSIPPGSPGYVDPATLNNLELAGPIGITTGAVFTDDIGGSKGRYYWARNVNRLDNQGPFNAVSGTLAETAVDVEFLLTTLTDSITSSQLAAELATPISTIPAITTAANDALAQAQAAQADADSALAGVTVNANGITTLTTTTDTLTTNLSALSTTVGSNSSSIVSLQTTTADQATAITNLTTRVGTAESDITSLETTTATQATALTTLTTRVTTAESDISTAESNITNLQTTTANQATAITQLSSSVAGNTAAIQTEATTRADETGDLFAQYTVKVDTNGYVSGFGLASTLVNGAPFSEFIIRADSFAIAQPTTGTPTIAPAVPFIVRTTATTIGGVNVPAGVYMTDAFIQNGTISNAKIANLAVDNAKIANLSVSNGKIQDLAVTNAKIANATITSAKIGLAEIKTANIEDLAVGTAKIANAAITNAKVNDLSADKLTAGTINTANVTISGTSSTGVDLKSAASGQRMEIKSTKILIYDSSNVLRVKLGDLS